MGNLFRIDSPIMVFLSTLADVIFLNFLCLICCLPVITIGPAITALHYVTVKMAKEENGYIVRSYFKAFKENFRQSFMAWIVFLIITVIFILDIKIIQNAGMDGNGVFTIVTGAIYLFMCLIVMYVFPLLSHFENTLGQTVKNALFMSILHIFKTIIMAVIYALPFILLPVNNNMILVFLMGGIAGPAYINSFIWNSIFKKYEPEEDVEKNGNKEPEVLA